MVANGLICSRKFSPLNGNYRMQCNQMHHSHIYVGYSVFGVCDADFEFLIAVGFTIASSTGEKDVMLLRLNMGCCLHTLLSDSVRESMSDRCCTSWNSLRFINFWSLSFSFACQSVKRSKISSFEKCISQLTNGGWKMFLLNALCIVRTTVLYSWLFLDDFIFSVVCV